MVSNEGRLPSPYERLCLGACDPEALEKLSQEEALDELREMNIDVGPLTEKIQALVRPEPAKALPSQIPQTQPVDFISAVVRQMGDQEDSVAQPAMQQFVCFANTHRQSLFDYLGQVVFKKGIEGPQRESLLERLVRPFRETARIPAYLQQQDEVLAEEALAWVEHPSTSLRVLVSGPYRTVLVAGVDRKKVGTRKGFGAFWLHLNPQHHVVCFSSDELLGGDRCDALVHEVGHMKKGCFTAKPSGRIPEAPNKEDLDMESESTSKSQPSTPKFYVDTQRDVDPEPKRLVAEWVSQHLKLGNGAGLIIDAGTSCLTAWEVIVEQISSGELQFLTVYTNNYLVLDAWWKNAYIGKTNVEIIGSVLDADHMAFYGNEAVAKVMAGNFRAMNVYIGTSGIHFDPHQGRILFAYHASDAERTIKELLFQCDANRRIILATPGRVGSASASGRYFDVLNISNLNTRSPIYLVTVNPEEGTAEEEAFDKAKEAFRSPAMEEKIGQKGLVFHWVTIDRHNGEGPTMSEHLVVPCDADAKML